MRLKLQNLKHVVRRARSEEKIVEALRAEVTRVLGPIMNTNLKLESLAEQVNDRVAVLNRTGRTAHFGFKSSTVVPFMNHPSAEVRMMSANLVPSQQLGKLAVDPHSMVRAVVAQRADMQIVREMMRRFPRDENLRSIYQQRKVLMAEAGLPNAKPNDEEFDINGDGPLGDAVKQQEGPELTDEWYHTMALKLFEKYDKNLEGNWEEKAVNNLVRHSKVTNGVEIDGEKLLNVVKKYIKERDDRVLERDSLKEIAARLHREADLLEESTTVYYTDDVDPVRDLLEANLLPTQYIEQANKILSVRHSDVPPGIKKHKLGERAVLGQKIPMKARLPHGKAIRSLDEQALDRYVRYWNGHQRLNGEPMKIEWNSHPSEECVIGFSIKEAFEQERPVLLCKECGERVQAHCRSHDGFGFMFECATCDYGWES
jgi:hypothetical protein